MQYLSSIILSWAPFLADPDFQILVMAAMTCHLVYKLLQKTFKIFATTIKITSIVAIIGLITYLSLEQPKKEHILGDKVGLALDSLKDEFPTILSEVRDTLNNKSPKT